MNSFSTVYEMLVDLATANTAFYLSSWRVPHQIDLNVGDWEEVRLFTPGCHVASKTLYGVPVQTWSGLRHGQFRLRYDGEVVYRNH